MWSRNENYDDDDGRNDRYYYVYLSDNGTGRIRMVWMLLGGMLFFFVFEDDDARSYYEEDDEQQRQECQYDQDRTSSPSCAPMIVDRILDFGVSRWRLWCITRISFGRYVYY